MRKVLIPLFFNRPTLRVAKELLGKFLVRRIGDKKISGMITEVEAYVGPKDKASHASRLWRGSLASLRGRSGPRAARGRTERTKVMFGKLGYWYVYLIYGMYHCLNIVTEKENYPAAILIRSVENVKGPGRICRKFKIDKKYNEKPASRRMGLWIEDRGVKINPRNILRGKRIGVDYAGKWKDKPWRFFIKS